MHTIDLTYVGLRIVPTVPDAADIYRTQPAEESAASPRGAR